MIELHKKDGEVDIKLKFYNPLGKKPKISIFGEADSTHHLIEGLFDTIDLISKQEGTNHLSKEWKELSDSKIRARLSEI